MASHMVNAQINGSHFLYYKITFYFCNNCTRNSCIYLLYKFTNYLHCPFFLHLLYMHVSPYTHISIYISISISTYISICNFPFLNLLREFWRHHAPVVNNSLCISQARGCPLITTLWLSKLGNWGLPWWHSG